MNGHPGRLTTHTRPGLLGGPGRPTARESDSFPGRRSRPATQSLHYAPEAMTRRPDRLGSSPADKLTAAVTTAPGPTQRPARPIVSSQSRPPSRARAARGCPSPFPPRLRRGRLPRKRPPARPAAGRSGRGRSPPPAGLLTSSSGSSSSFSRSRGRHSRRQRHFRSSRPISSALRRGRGRKARPPGEKAGRQEADPAHPEPACGSEMVGCLLPPRAATFASEGLSARPQLQVRPLGRRGRGGSASRAP